MSIKYKGQTISGPPGKDATINGENALTIQAGENVSITQEGGVMTIGADGATMEQVNDAITTANATKQDKLTGTQGQVVGFGADGAAAAVRGWSNPNLLDNWYFADPINQRGQTEYAGTSSSAYCFDRWLCYGAGGAVFTKIDGGIEIDNTAAADNTCGLMEVIESAELLPGETYTLSALVRIVEDTGDGAPCVCLSYGAGRTSISGTSVLPSELTEGYILRSFTFALPNSTDDVYNFRIRSKRGGIKFRVKAMKLELGPVQTLAHQDAAGNWVLNDPPPNKALELAKCQRYFQVFSSGSARPANLVDYRPPMRANPALGTITINGTTYYTADANL